MGQALFDQQQQAYAGNFDAAQCRSAYLECRGNPPAVDGDDFADCGGFAVDARACNGLRVGDLTPCALAWGERWVAVGDAASSACDAPVPALQLLTIPDACGPVFAACPDLLREPSPL
jgi:hypothetical protein